QLDVTVTHQLARLVAAERESCTEHHVVEPRLEQAQQVLTRDALHARGFLVIVAELTLENAVDAARALLLTKLHAIALLFRWARGTTVLARRERTLLDGALRRLALGALEEQFDALA